MKKCTFSEVAICVVAVVGVACSLCLRARGGEVEVKKMTLPESILGLRLWGYDGYFDNPDIVRRDLDSEWTDGFWRVGKGGVTTFHDSAPPERGWSFLLHEPPRLKPRILAQSWLKPTVWLHNGCVMATVVNGDPETGKIDALSLVRLDEKGEQAPVVSRIDLPFSAEFLAEASPGQGEAAVRSEDFRVTEFMAFPVGGGRTPCVILGGRVAENAKRPVSVEVFTSVYDGTRPRDLIRWSEAGATLYRDGRVLDYAFDGETADVQWLEAEQGQTGQARLRGLSFHGGAWCEKGPAVNVTVSEADNTVWKSGTGAVAGYLVNGARVIVISADGRSEVLDFSTVGTPIDVLPAGKAVGPVIVLHRGGSPHVLLFWDLSGRLPICQTPRMEQIQEKVLWLDTDDRGFLVTVEHNLVPEYDPPAPFKSRSVGKAVWCTNPELETPIEASMKRLQSMKRQPAPPLDSEERRRAETLRYR